MAVSVLAYRRLAWLLMHDGQYPAARDAINRALQINPQGDPLRYVSHIELLAGRPREGLVAVPADSNEGKYIVLAMLEHSLGHDAESQRALDFLLTHHANVWGYQIAQVYAWRGEKDRAFEWLNRSYDRHDGGLSYSTYDRLISNLRTDPRYAALMRKLNLPIPPAHN